LSKARLIKFLNFILHTANWLEHFSKLLGAPSKTNNVPLPKHKISDTLDIKTDIFIIDELKHCIKSLSLKKSPGLDMSQLYCGKIHSPPSAWLKGGIIPAPKKGDLSSPPTTWDGM